MSEKVKYKKMTTRKRSMESLLIVFICGLVVVTGCILSFTIYYKSKDLLQKQVQTNALNLAKTTAANIDGKTFSEIPDTGEDSKEYASVLEELVASRENSDIMYIYSFRKASGEGVQFVVDADKEEPAANGEKYEMLPEMKKAFEGTPSVDSEVSTDQWGSYISGYAPIFDGKKVVGIVGVDISYTMVLRELNQLKLQIALIAIVILVIMVGGISYIIRKFREGINVLNDKIIELSEGDGDLNREIELNSGDEFEEISHSINHFIRNVRDMVKAVADKSVNTEHVIQDMNGKVVDLNSSMTQCSVTAEGISAKLSDTANHVAILAEQVNAIDASVAEAEEHAGASAKNARLKKEKAMTDIAQIKDTINHASKQAKAVEEVLKVTAEIDKIATQMTILSLNAQVEASRAGESGQGFAVVAEEMQSLNEKIAESVKHISNINEAAFVGVNSLLEGTADMEAYLTEHVLGDYDDYAQVGKDYGETVEQIHEAMTKLNENAIVISGEVTKADSDIMEINTAVSRSSEQIAGISKASQAIAYEMEELTREPMIQMMH